MADVICPNCNESYHETSDQYRPDKAPHGGMFRLKEQYREMGWDSFVEDDASIQDNLFCPGCGGLYCEKGKVRVIGWFDQKISEINRLMAEYNPDLPEADDGKSPCPYCGERFKPSGLHFHIKAKHSA